MAAPSTDNSMVIMAHKSYNNQEEYDEDDYSDSDGEYDENNEAGLMDYRSGNITIKKLDDIIKVYIDFYFNYEEKYNIPEPYDFETKWCAKFDPKEIAEDALGGEFNILDASWEGSTLNITIYNKDKLHKKKDVLEYLEDNSLEDGPYEGFAGESFWVVSYKNLVDMNNAS